MTDKKQTITFDMQQLEEIRAGKEAGLDISLYASPAFHALQMHQLRLGLAAGIDVSVYADAAYDWFQMEELRLGLEKGLDVGFYADASITGDQMRQLRKAKLSGIELSAYKHLPSEVIRQMRKAGRSGVDILPYVKEEYTGEQLEQIILALENGTNIRPYLNKADTPEVIRELRLGLDAGLNISVYNSPNYNWKQMRELRLGLMRRVDTDIYRDAAYHWQQMRELRLGLEAGLDVRCYDNVKLSPMDMHRIRKEMVAQLTIPSAVDTEQRSVAELVAEIETKLAELPSQVQIRISEDHMEAFIKVPAADKQKYTVGDLVKLIMKNGIVYGLNQEAISQLAAKEQYGEEICIAKGIPVINGDDGYYEYMFRTEIPSIPTILPDGSVDYQNVQFFEYIKKGDVVAVYHPATAGITGYTVMGRPLPAKHGIEQQVLFGKHIHAEDDHVTYIADADGKIELKDSEIIISNLLEVDEVSYITGNVRFGGSVHIRGNVSNGMVVESGEDIVIDGNVEGATIRCGRNLLLKKGVLGGGNCQIRAEGTVTGKFFENADIYAKGDISGNYALNCQIYSGGQVTISGKKGVILGGCLQAVRGLTVHNIGNHAEVTTSIILGITRKMLATQRSLDESLKKVGAELDILYKAKYQFEQKLPPEVLPTAPMYDKIKKAIQIKDQELRTYTKDRALLLADMQGLEGVKASIQGEIFEGVTVTINGFTWRAKHVKYLELHVEGDHVGLFTYDGKAIQDNA